MPEKQNKKENSLFPTISIRTLSTPNYKKNYKMKIKKFSKK